MLLWKNCSQNVISIESDIKTELYINTNLRMPSPYSQERNVSYKLAFNQYELFKKKYAPVKSTRHKLIFYTKFLIKNKIPIIYSILRKMKK